MSRTLRIVTLALMVGWLVLPLVPLGLWSVARGWFFPEVLPQAVSLDAWRFALSPASGVPEALALTTLIAAAATVLAVLIGVPAGRALALHDFRGKRLVEIALLAPVIVPGIAVVLGLHAVFLHLGLTNTLAGVILVHLIPTLPYMTLVMAGVFAGFDTDHEAQARSLGAPAFQAFVRVTLPMVAPGIVVGALFAFLVSWSQYILTLAIGGGRIQTLPLLLFGYATSGRPDLAGAIGLIYIAPGALVIALTARVLTGRSASLAGRL